MPLTLQQVQFQLDTDEPNYTALAQLGAESVPILALLVRGAAPGIASKAAYLASLIDSDDAHELVENAASSPHDIVRVAAAAGLRNLAPEQVTSTVDRLLDDKDVGVRKQALLAAAGLGIVALKPKLQKIAARDREPGLRQLAKQSLLRLTEAATERLNRPIAAPKSKRTKHPARRRPRK